MASSVISCKKSRVRLDGIDLYANRWSIEIRADELDVTNFESDGYVEYITAYVDATITVDALWDTAFNDFSLAGGGVNVGRSIDTCRFYLNRDAGLLFEFSTIVIVSVTPEASVRDVMRYSFTARPRGSWIYPGGLEFTGTL
jgi:hypothetical protein